jgi:hypothetical protein
MCEHEPVVVEATEFVKAETPGLFLFQCFSAIILYIFTETIYVFLCVSCQPRFNYATTACTDLKLVPM